MPDVMRRASCSGRDVSGRSQLSEGRVRLFRMSSELVLYEAMYILDASLSDEEIASLEEHLKTVAEGEGAEVQSFEEFGRRRLAYRIEEHTEGIYRVMYFRGTGRIVDEVKREFFLSEQIIRGVIVVANPRMMVTAPSEEPEIDEEAVDGEEAAPEAIAAAIGPIACSAFIPISAKFANSSLVNCEPPKRSFSALDRIRSPPSASIEIPPPSCDGPTR